MCNNVLMVEVELSDDGNRGSGLRMSYDAIEWMGGVGEG